MRLGRDIQFSSILWLSVAFVLGVAIYSTASIGDHVIISRVDLIPVFPRSVCSEMDHLFSPCFPPALRSPFVSSCFVCTRRSLGENSLMWHGEGVCRGGGAAGAVPHTAKGSSATAMRVGFDGLVAAVASGRGASQSDPDDPMGVLPLVT